MFPFYVGSQLSCFARYQKIVSGWLFKFKNLLNFNCHTMKFHSCHHATNHSYEIRQRFSQYFTSLKVSFDVQSFPNSNVEEMWAQYEQNAKNHIDFIVETFIESGPKKLQKFKFE